MTFEVTALEVTGKTTGKVKMECDGPNGVSSVYMYVPVAKLTEYKFGQQFELVYAGVPSLQEEP